MVCDRCIAFVQKTFRDHGVLPLDITLGEVRLNDMLSKSDLVSIQTELKSQGFEIIDSDTPVLITKIKASLISLFNQDEVPEKLKLSKFLIEKFPYDYSHLSRLFSHHEKDTIEHYVIKLRIEKAKELLAYKDQNVSEVAYKLGYASAAHFSRQFKKLVGLSPSVYKENPTGRQSLEDI